MHKQAVLLGGFMKGKTMSECMAFPKEWEKFIEDYSFTDSEEVYTNGSELVPVFRVEQMVEHYFATDNNDGCKRIEELEAKLAEREKVVIQLRKQSWQKERKWLYSYGSNGRMRKCSSAPCADTSTTISTMI